MCDDDEVTAAAHRPNGYFAIARPRIYPVPEDMRQETLAAARGLIFISEAPAKHLQFWAGIGEWQVLTGLASTVYIGANDNYVRVALTRSEAAVWLRAKAPHASLPD